MENKETINIGDICIYDPLSTTRYRRQSKLNILHPDFIMLVVDIKDEKNHYTCLSSRGEKITIHFDYLTKVSLEID